MQIRIRLTRYTGTHLETTAQPQKLISLSVCMQTIRNLRAVKTVKSVYAARVFSLSSSPSLVLVIFTTLLSPIES